MALWRLYYHLVWATTERRPLITPDLEPDLYGYIIGKADALGCITHAIGGVEDHIHLIASIPPSLAISEFVQKIKGSSTHHLNQEKTRPKFGWQRGYGVFSLGSKQLADAIAYVENQKAHHQQRTTIAALEQHQPEDDGPMSQARRGINSPAQNQSRLKPT
jgi:REP element-mobilizing transposase RayT